MLATHAQREAALAAVRAGQFAACARAGVQLHRKLVRKDAPAASSGRCGKFPELNLAAAREAAVKAVEADVYAASSKAGGEVEAQDAEEGARQVGTGPHTRPRSRKS